MSNCINQNCKLCRKIVLSQAITFDAATNALIVDLPAQNYGNNCTYCIILAQPIPDTTTINAQVVFTIGGVTTTTYQFLNYDCTPIFASQVRTRTRYKTRVSTTIGTGVFKYIGNCKLPCNASIDAQSIPIPTTTPTTNTPT